MIAFEIDAPLPAPIGTTSSVEHSAPPIAGSVWNPKRSAVSVGAAVMFSIEGPVRGEGPEIVGCAYVFIDDYCYSVDYNDKDKFWFFVRGEPGLSACYHGPAAKLPPLVAGILAGKEVKVPVKAPETKEDRDQRAKQVDQILRESRGKEKR